VQGQFIIHELVADGAGRITKLALDFTSPQGVGAGLNLSSFSRSERACSS
jgi:hypothetical protein